MESNDRIKKLLALLDQMQVGEENKDLINEIKEHLKNNEIALAMKKLEIIKNRPSKPKK